MAPKTAFWCSRSAREQPWCEKGAPTVMTPRKGTVEPSLNLDEQQ